MKKYFFILALLCHLTSIFASTTTDSTNLIPTMYHYDDGIVGGTFSLRALFEEPEAFDKGTFVLSIAAGFKNNISVTSDDAVRVPPLLVIAEFPVYPNIGVGFSAGAMLWEPSNNTTTRYAYYTFSPRVAYHLNLGERFDAYAGVHLNGRMATAQIENSDIKGLNRTKIDVGAHFGLRFYLKPAIGLFLEYGADGPACFKGGIAFRFGH